MISQRIKLKLKSNLSLSQTYVNLNPTSGNASYLDSAIIPYRKSLGTFSIPIRYLLIGQFDERPLD